MKNQSPASGRLHDDISLPGTATEGQITRRYMRHGEPHCQIILYCSIIPENVTGLKRVCVGTLKYFRAHRQRTHYHITHGSYLRIISSLCHGAHPEAENILPTRRDAHKMVPAITDRKVTAYQLDRSWSNAG
jgi:hypothetical protein